MLELPSNLRTLTDDELLGLIAQANRATASVLVELQTRRDIAQLPEIGRPTFMKRLVHALESRERGRTFSPRMVIVAVLFAILCGLPALASFGGAFLSKVEEAKAKIEADK
jgi:hypothetical protein